MRQFKIDLINMTTLKLQAVSHNTTHLIILISDPTLWYYVTLPACNFNAVILNQSIFNCPTTSASNSRDPLHFIMYMKISQSGPAHTMHYLVPCTCEFNLIGVIYH